MRRAAVILGAAALAVPAMMAGADPGEATHVDEVSASVDGGSVTVTGTATFVDVPVTAATDGTDPVNHGKLPATDLTGASISRPPGAEEIRLAIDVGNQIPEVHSYPVIPYYRWTFDVVAGFDSSRFLVFGNPASGANNLEPDFKVWSCNPSAPPPNCTTVGTATGAFTDAGLFIDVPAGTINAQPGSTITSAGSNQITVQPGAGTPLVEGQLGILLDVMTQTQDYTVPGATVRLGIAEAGTPANQVPLTVSASVNPVTGAFSGALLPEGTGEMVVAAQACYGSGNCDLASTSITIG
jgi:hypothetical protein